MNNQRVFFHTLSSDRLLDREAKPYIPSEPVLQEEDDDDDAVHSRDPLVECYFGPHNAQTKRTLTTFDVVDMSASR